jgi:hypothetical protein
VLLKPVSYQQGQKSYEQVVNTINKEGPAKTAVYPNYYALYKIWDKLSTGLSKLSTGYQQSYEQIKRSVVIKRALWDKLPAICSERLFAYYRIFAKSPALSARKLGYFAPIL